MPPLSDDKYDLNKIIVKPLYFGLVVNVLIPMGLLFACYYFEGQQSGYNRIGESANPVFYLFCACALAQAAVALWWRSRLMKQPMIRKQETFEHDLIANLASVSQQIFVIIAAISLWGLVYYYLTARFKETVVLVLFSFIVFQFVRPRFAFIRKLIASQEELVKQGKFLQGG